MKHPSGATGIVICIKAKFSVISFRTEVAISVTRLQVSFMISLYEAGSWNELASMALQLSAKTTQLLNRFKANASRLQQYGRFSWSRI